MAFTHTITQKVTSGGNTVTADNSYSGGAQVSLDESIPDSSTDLLVVVALDVSKIQSIYILSDQDMTLETNDGTTPADTINLLAGKPYIWHIGSYFTNLLATDVTAFYMTNASGSSAQLKMEAVLDPTP